MTEHRIRTTSFASVCSHYVAKVEKTGRTKEEVDQVIRWLTGYRQAELEAQLERKTDFETLFADAPQMNPARGRHESCDQRYSGRRHRRPTTREIRCPDKLVDELAKAKVMEGILREKRVSHLYRGPW